MLCHKFLPFTILAKRPEGKNPKRLENLPARVEKKKEMSEKIIINYF